MVSTILTLISFVSGIEIIVEIEGLETKVDIVLIVEIPSCWVAKFGEGGSTSYSVDEVLVTSVTIVLS